MTECDVKGVTRGDKPSCHNNFIACVFSLLLCEVTK